MSDSTLENKTVFITGASGGIGRATALLAARRGATVILHGKTLPKLEQLYDDIVAEKWPEPLIYPLDLEKASPDDFNTMQAAIEKEFGRLDVLINNAGWHGASMPVELFDIQLWHRLVQINLNAVFMLTRACLPLLKRADQAAVLFTADHQSSAYWGAYGVAKAGQLAFMEILADELEDSPVRVCALDPGPVRTSLRVRAFPGENPQQHKTPEDVAPVMLKLLNEGEQGRCYQWVEVSRKSAVGR